MAKGHSFTGKAAATPSHPEPCGAAAAHVRHTMRNTCGSDAGPPAERTREAGTWRVSPRPPASVQSPDRQSRSIWCQRNLRAACGAHDRRTPQRPVALPLPLPLALARSSSRPVASASGVWRWPAVMLHLRASLTEIVYGLTARHSTYGTNDIMAR
jgi:hypothetical protein